MNFEERPQKIKDLLYYFQNKEILLYLFLINCKLIPDETIHKEWSLANVSFQDGNFVLRYNEERFEEMTREEIYFVLLHEAFHVFKLHLTLRDRFKGRDNFELLNLAMDAVINEEIKEIAGKNNEEEHKLLIPKIETFPVFYMPDEFKKKFPKDKHTTEIVYDFLLENGPKLGNPKDLLVKGGFCKVVKPGDKNDGDYGQIMKIDGNGDCDVDILGKDEIIDRILNPNKDAKNNPTSKGNYSKEELIPVIPGVEGQKFKNPGEKAAEIEVVMPDIGSFKRSEEEGDGGNAADEYRSETMLKKMVEEAKQLKKLEDKDHSSTGSGNFLYEKINELYSKKLINWKSLLRRNVDLFIVKEKANDKKYKKSYITYLRNPKSRYGILYKHLLKEKNNFAPYVILAIDTSGSIFMSENELKLFFTEIENLSRWLETMKGKVLTVQWDTTITERLTAYRTGDWKKISHGKKNIVGGGGTDPTSVFKYLEKIFQKNENSYFVNENEISWQAPWGKFPLLVFLTDGYFYKLRQENLRIYKEAEKKILYLTENTENIYPKENYIIYNRESL